MAQSAPGKGYIDQSLLDLMTEKPFKDISVSEIARKAGISRQAFYMYYNGKEEVVIEQFNKFFTKILSTIKDVHIETVEQLVTTYTSLVFENARYLKLISDNNLGPLLGDVLVEHFVKMPPVVPSQRVTESISEQKYIISFWIHAFIQAYTIWINNGMDTPMEELNKFLVDTMKGNYFKK